MKIALLCKFSLIFLQTQLWSMEKKKYFIYNNSQIKSDSSYFQMLTLYITYT